MGRNSKYKNTRAIASAQSFQPNASSFQSTFSTLGLPDIASAPLSQYNNKEYLQLLRTVSRNVQKIPKGQLPSSAVAIYHPQLIKHPLDTVLEMEKKFDISYTPDPLTSVPSSSGKSNRPTPWSKNTDQSLIPFLENPKNPYRIIAFTPAFLQYKNAFDHFHDASQNALQKYENAIKSNASTKERVKLAQNMHEAFAWKHFYRLLAWEESQKPLDNPSLSSSMLLYYKTWPSQLKEFYPNPFLVYTSEKYTPSPVRQTERLGGYQNVVERYSAESDAITPFVSPFQFSASRAGWKI